MVAGVSAYRIQGQLSRVCILQRHSTDRGARRLTVSAGLPGSGILSTALEAATLVGVVLGVSNSLRAGKASAGSRKPTPLSDEDEADGVQWGVMSVISALPWFNGLVGQAATIVLWLCPGMQHPDSDNCRLGCLQP